MLLVIIYLVYHIHGHDVRNVNSIRSYMKFIMLQLYNFCLKMKDFEFRKKYIVQRICILNLFNEQKQRST